MPWENTEKFIRSGHRSVEDFQAGALKTITIDEKEGIQAIVGKPKGKLTMEVQSFNESAAETPTRSRSITRAGEDELYRRGVE